MANERQRRSTKEVEMYIGVSLVGLLVLVLLLVWLF
jgi:flagellar biogenesis protein FliO